MGREYLEELDAKGETKKPEKIIVVLYRWIIYGSECKKYHFSGKN